MWFILGLLVGLLVGMYANWRYMTRRYSWEVIKAERGVWKDGSAIAGHCNFEIQFSRRTGEFRVVCSGYKPKNHGMYGAMVQEANKFRLAYMATKGKDQYYPND